MCSATRRQSAKQELAVPLTMERIVRRVEAQTFRAKSHSHTVALRGEERHLGIGYNQACKLWTRRDSKKETILWTRGRVR